MYWPAPTTQQQHRRRGRYWVGAALVASAVAVGLLSLLLGLARVVSDGMDTRALDVPGSYTLELDDGRYDLFRPAESDVAPTVSVTGPAGEYLPLEEASSRIEHTIEDEEWALFAMLDVAEPGGHIITATAAELAPTEEGATQEVAIGPSFDDTARSFLLVLAAGTVIGLMLSTAGVLMMVRTFLAASCSARWSQSGKYV